MRVEIVVPQIGEAIAELHIVAWYKQVGDMVKKGDVLFEVDSDKAIVEVESFVDGKLVEVYASAGSAVMPRDVVALVETEAHTAIADESPESPPVQPIEQLPGREVRVSPVAQRLAAELDVDIATVAGSGPGGRVMADDVRRLAEREPGSSATVATPTPAWASPRAKRMAAELNVELRDIAGTGTRGLVTGADIERTLETMSPSTPSQDISAGAPAAIPLTRLRQAIAQSMLASKQQVPHFYLMVDVNMTQVNGLRAYCTNKLNWEKAPTYTDVLVRTCAKVLEAMPSVNISYSDTGLVRHNDISIGVAVSTEAGLVVPVIPGADKLTLRDTSQAVRSAALRARQGRMKSADTGPKSLVVSNLGMYGIDAFIAIIDMPDPMIRAVGRVADRVVSLSGQIVVQPMCTLTLSVDHRALDGVQGAQFLDALKNRLESPFDIL